MIIVAGTLRIPPEKMDVYRRHAATMIAETRAEPGCITYSFAEDVVEPGLIRIFEIWHRREHLVAHGQAPHLAPWHAALKEIGATGRDLKTYEAEDGIPL